MVNGLAVGVAGTVGLAVLVPVLALGSDTQAQAAGGFGTGLRAGSVPAAYADLVLGAGSLCAAAPPSIIAAQIEQESGWNPAAVSSVGAQGISQFMPATWPAWSSPGQSPFDPAAAIPAQGRYDCAIAATMKQAQASGDLPAGLDVTSLMLAGYNAGSGAVLAAGGIPQNGQTPDYVARITARAANFSDSTGTTTAAATSDAPAGSFAARVIAAASTQLGKPYSWGGGSYTAATTGVCTSGVAANACYVTGWDCSGLTMFALYQASGGRIRVPHSSDAQTRPGAGGVTVPRDAMRAGDLISFTSPHASAAHHVGIYLGSGRMLDAPSTGSQVRVDSLASRYWQQQSWRVARFG